MPILPSNPFGHFYFMARPKNETLSKSGIYKIYFEQDPSIFYVGSAINFHRRKTRHIYQLKNETHKNTYLQRLCNKYGVKSLIFEILETVSDHNNLISTEQYYIDKLSPKINILKTAGSALGYKHSEESKNTIRIKNLGRKMTQEQIRKGVESRKGQRTQKGCKRSAEFIKHLSEIKKRKVINAISGKIYNSIGDAAIDVGLKYSTLYAKLSGKNTNTTNIKFI